MSHHSSSYSYDSLSDVFNIANRKGKMQKKYLSKEYLDAAQEYREMRKELNGILRKKKESRTATEEELIEELKKEMGENAKTQKILLQKHLTTVSSNILSGEFRFTLTPDVSKDPQKPLYILGDTPEEYFAMQALCRNVKRLFKISMAGRDEILSQLKMLLKEDKHSYYIIRTDVQHCFESIPHEQLFQYLEDNSLLDVKSKSLLHGLIKKEFEAKNLRPVVKTPNTGVPRGCAISSLLAEFYLFKIDKELKRKFPEIIFLGRYVDDMVLVIHPDIAEVNHKKIDEYVNEISNLYKAKGLTIHTPSDGTGKCYTYDSESTENLKFELLGYGIMSIKDNPNMQGYFSLAKKKNDKIRGRIKKTFAKFNDLLDTSTYDIAAHYLFDALHVLTCNINLYNAKKGVKVGIYYSNQLLDNEKNINGLDCYLRYCCNAISLSGKKGVEDGKHAMLESTLKKQLLQVSFTDGFSAPHKRYKISKDRLKTIKQSWV